MLIFRLVMLEARRAFFHNEPARSSGGSSQNRVSIGDAAVADPLFQAVDLIADDAVPIHYPLCRAF